MEFIKWMWHDFTLAQKIVVVCLVAMLGVSVYGLTYHPVWVIALLTNLLVLWWIVDTEWCLYTIKKRMDKLGGGHDI